MTAKHKLNARDRAALDQFTQSQPMPRPKGVGGGTLINLLGQKWIRMAGYDEEIGEQRYVLTAEGWSVLAKARLDQG